MFEFLNRIPTKPLRRKITREDGTSEFVTIEMADEPSEEGTKLNRDAFMALQGFEAKTTTFNEDGSITETNADGDTLTTTFNEDGSITETFAGKKGITKTTTFNEDGSISEVIS